MIQRLKSYLIWLQNSLICRRWKKKGLDIWGDIQTISIGTNCSFGGNVRLGGNYISIGNNCMFAFGVQIISVTHNYNHDRHTGYHVPIIIGDNVWIGVNAIILPGLTIGDNAVIGAGSVVTKDIPKNTVVAGNPARKINMVKFYI